MTKVHTSLYLLLLTLITSPLYSAEKEQAKTEKPIVKKLKLESTIVANKELPKVMTIVPWQVPQQGTVDTTPFLAEMRSIFEPIEVSSLKKELEYFNRRKK